MNPERLFFMDRLAGAHPVPEFGSSRRRTKRYRARVHVVTGRR
jgi:hypothetical protein